MGLKRVFINEHIIGAFMWSKRMNNILLINQQSHNQEKDHYFQQLETELIQTGFHCINNYDLDATLEILKNDNRIVCVIMNWEQSGLTILNSIGDYNPNLPIFTISNKQNALALNLENFHLNLDFLQFDSALMKGHLQRIKQAINHYYQAILPPFTKKLIHYVSENNYTFSTPGHQAGHGFQCSPVGCYFYDFYQPNIFKSDISVSMEEMGSLLEHSGPHAEAESYISDTFDSDRSLIVTNGTSTANKIVGMYAIADGDTVLVDRNCHKSVAHLLMMVNANPIYLKPERNAYGIIGGIPQKAFTTENIQKQLDAHLVANSWPTYAVITNSNYDGLFYNVDYIKQTLETKLLHFDSAWTPYTHFHPIYKGMYGIESPPKKSQTVFETQSTHKLLAAFSQGSMIHIKGSYNADLLNEIYMMHTSTSPFYPLVASCETSAAMMRGRQGYHLLNDIILCAMNFRREMVKLKTESKDWFYTGVFISACVTLLFSANNFPTQSSPR